MRPGRITRSIAASSFLFVTNLLVTCKSWRAHDNLSEIKNLWLWAEKNGVLVFNSAKVFRSQLPRQNPYYSSQPPPEPTGLYLFAAFIFLFCSYTTAFSALCSNCFIYLFIFKFASTDMFNVLHSRYTIPWRQLERRYSSGYATS